MSVFRNCFSMTLSVVHLCIELSPMSRSAVQQHYLLDVWSCRGVLERIWNWSRSSSLDLRRRIVAESNRLVVTVKLVWLSAVSLIRSDAFCSQYFLYTFSYAIAYRNGSHAFMLLENRFNLSSAIHFTILLITFYFDLIYIRDVACGHVAEA